MLISICVVTCGLHWHIIEMMRTKASLLIVSMSNPQHTPVHRPLVAHPRPQISILPKICNSVNIEIMNKCDGITLGSGTCTTLKGRDKRDFKEVLPPSESLSTLIRSKCLIGCTKFCIVYELLDSENPTIPPWREYRVFLVVQVFAMPFFGENSATAILFKIKDRKFNGEKEDIQKLHEDVLQHSMCRPHKAAVWNLGGQALSLNPKFDFNVPVSVRVVLEKSQLSIEHDPIFHRVGAFA
jgi:hypothetical protein